jgi:quinol monooxygenase YgiN
MTGHPTRANDMIVVSGRIYLTPGSREEFLLPARDAMIAARAASGCRDFVVAADPIEADRVNVYEEWDSAGELEAFRGDGPSPAQAAAVTRAEVSRHHIARSGPP